MLLSYLKIAWRGWQRRKFFTGISLFGISFTLMTLVVLFTLFDHAVGARPPSGAPTACCSSTAWCCVGPWRRAPPAWAMPF
ncbi:hypothetical protein [Hymenobacter coccineus]|uniref:hypothetical protein n=1 Tax=Hymenobacter coccineus TaxID=1908235 RepID=UPI000F76DF86|nr:hypothetical protein [Hymenobacter coccineus]